jgi:hypothetical protein
MLCGCSFGQRVVLRVLRQHFRLAGGLRGIEHGFLARMATVAVTFDGGRHRQLGIHEVVGAHAAHPVQAAS